MEIFIGIMIPFIGTFLGSLMVYFIKNKLNRNFEIIILGFSAGVMIAASIWSLIMPSIDLSSTIFPPVIGLILGILIFYIIDYILDKKEHSNSVNNMMFAITLHNIPEGMAVGIAYASLLNNTSNVTLASCIALSIGIAIQNFPEGAIVSLPLRKKGYSKNKAFLYGVISALFETFGAIITLAFTSIISVILPYLLALAAGAMIYVVIIELIPESISKNKINVLAFTFGFIIMMVLDVLLG